MFFFLIIAMLFQPIFGTASDFFHVGELVRADVFLADAGPTVSLKHNKYIFSVEVADDDEERARGLMYRQKLAKNQGMLFIFPFDAPQTFWMKNTFIPLDMIFADRDLRIVKIQKGAVPCAEKDDVGGGASGRVDVGGGSCPLYPSIKPAKYVLEINAGLSAKMKLREGEKIVLDAIAVPGSL